MSSFLFDEYDYSIQSPSMVNNPYIDKIDSNSHIWQDDQKILAQKGEWKNFFNKNKLMVEIGTGMGNFFAHYALSNPDTACVGIELKFKRLFRTYEKCVQRNRSDVILLRFNWQKLGDIFGIWEVDVLYLLFSDPWPKKAHIRNRVVQTEFLKWVSDILSIHGEFFIKTDDDQYSKWIEEHLRDSGLFTYIITSDEDPDKRTTTENSTEFETIWRKEWKKITGFHCKKIQS